MSNCKTINKCLLCSGKLKEVLSFGKTPLANDFLTREEYFSDSSDKDELFDLTLMRCKECNHVQLQTLVDENRLYKHYLYVSGTNSTNVEHFKQYAEKVEKRFLNKDDLIIDIASNDGTFLKFFTCDKLGIDPALNLVKEAEKNGIKNIPVFFNESTANELSKEIKKAKVITANNVMAHNRDLRTIINGVKRLLTPDGIFIFENSYLLDMLDNTIFDVIYHEHMHHHHLSPLVKFFDSLDMKIFDLEKLPNHGGSIRVYVCRKSNNLQIQSIIQETLNKEKDVIEKLNNFEDNINELKRSLKNKIRNIKMSGKTIAAYGAPAKATTLLYAFGLNNKVIDFAIDDNALKQQRYFPGNHIPIYPSKAISIYRPDYLLILAWNFAKSIIENNKSYSGKWIIPLPNVEEV